MAGVCFQDQPDVLAGREFQGARGAGRDVHDKFDATVDAGFDERTFRLQLQDVAGEDVAGAEAVRRLRGEQDVARANGDADAVAGASVAERHFDFAVTFAKAEAHDAVGFA